MLERMGKFFLVLVVVQINIVIEISLEISQKPETELPYDLSSSLLGVYLENFIPYNGDICISVFIDAVFTIARNWNQPGFY